MLETPVVHGPSEARTLFICSIVYQLLHYSRVRQSGGVSQIVKFVRSDLSQDASHDLSGRVFGSPGAIE